MLKIDIPEADFYFLDSHGKMVEHNGSLHRDNYLTLDFDEVDNYNLVEFGRPNEMVRSAKYHDALRIEIGDDAQLIDLSSVSVTRRTKGPTKCPECSCNTEEKVFSVMTQDEAIILQADQSEEAALPEEAGRIDIEQKNGTGSHRIGQMCEDDYASILLDSFDFAWFDNNLFVRQDDVYHLVTPNLVAQLLGKVLSASELRQFSVSRRQGISEHLALITAVDAPTLSIPQGKLLLQNGVVDLRTMRLSEPDPLLYFPCRLCASWLRNPAPTPH